MMPRKKDSIHCRKSLIEVESQKFQSHVCSEEERKNLVSMELRGDNCCA